MARAIKVKEEIAGATDMIEAVVEEDAVVVAGEDIKVCTDSGKGSVRKISISYFIVSSNY